MFKKRLLAILVSTIWLSSSGAIAAPPGIFHGTETLADRDMASLAIDLGYEYNEIEALGANTPLESDEIPVLLRAQLTPLLELRAGATPRFNRGDDSNATYLEGAALLNILPPTSLTPGFGFLLRAMGPMEETNDTHFADLDIRGVMTLSLVDLLMLDLNLGYWMGMGGGSFCEFSENGSFCESTPNHFIPFMAAARISLFDLLDLYVESENYLTLDEALGDLYSKVGLGGRIGLGDSLSLQIGMGLGVTETAESLTIKTGLTWHFFRF